MKKTEAMKPGDILQLRSQYGEIQTFIVLEHDSYYYYKAFNVREQNIDIFRLLPPEQYRHYEAKILRRS